MHGEYCKDENQGLTQWMYRNGWLLMESGIRKYVNLHCAQYNHFVEYLGVFFNETLLFPVRTFIFEWNEDKWWSWSDYHQTSNIIRSLVCNKIVDHSDVVKASPVGAAPTTSSFPKHLSIGMRCALYWRCYDSFAGIDFCRWCLIWLKSDCSSSLQP